MDDWQQSQKVGENKAENEVVGGSNESIINKCKVYFRAL